ncbi:isopeptide-forming domain-containing fimbrial protein, partial [Oscillatoriales cyanobacterium LEGE 11467]
TQDVLVTETGTSTGDAGDTVTLTITLTHDATTPDAFETALTDAIPAEIQSPNLASATFNGTDVSGDFDLTGNNLTTLNPFDLTNGGEIVVTITGTLSSAVAPNQEIDNNADVTFSSLDGDGNAGVDPDTNILDDNANDTTDDRSTFVNPANDDERDYTAAATGTVLIENVSPVKSIVGSSEAETDNTTTNTEGNVITDDVAIGETVTFRLVVGLSEGTINGLKLQDNLPDGMQFVNGTARVALVNTDTNNLATNEAGLSGAIVANENDAFTPTVAFPDASVSTTATGNDDNYGSGTDIFFSFGDVTNTGTNAGSEFLVVEYDAVVLDVPGNEGGVSPTALTNNFDVIISGSSVNTSTDATVTVLEPELAIVQSLTLNGVTADETDTTTVPGGDAGDEVTITLDVTNSGTAGAYEVVVSDILDPAKFDLSTVDFGTEGTDYPTGYTPAVDLVTGEVTFTGGDIDGGNTNQQFSFTVDLADAVEPGETIDNVANITEATTIDGTPVSGIERDIADPDDIASNTEALTIDGPTLATRLVETEINDGNNDNTEAVIGELVTYELTLTIPEGTTPTSVLSDTLDPGLAFVGFTSIDLGGTTSTTIDDGDVADLTANTNVTNDGSDIEIDLGNLLNAGDNVGTQTITIQYQAVVQNVPANQGDGSETSPSLNNDPSFSWDNGAVQTIEEDALSDDITVIEPDLDIVKEVLVDGSGTEGDGGDSVVYTITIEHTGDSTADAFDLNLTDALPPEFVPDGSPISLGAGNTSGATAGDFSIDGSNNLQVVPGNVDLALGQVLVLEISGTIPDTVETGDTADSTATVTWTSLDGEVSDRSTHTTVGDEERTGDGTGDNDYTADDNAEFTITGTPEITTELVGSELDNGVDNGNTDAVPGELVTFRTTITVPEGTTSGVVLQELLDPGLAFVEITSISTPEGDVTGGFDFNDATAANGTATPGTNGSDFTLNLGDVVNTANSDGSPETIVVEYTAVVLNDAANQSTDNETGPTLNNTATLDWTNNPTPGTPLSTTSFEEVSVVEPQLEVVKDVAVNGAGAEGDAGDPIVYTITIQHTGSSEADAFDVNLTDVLPAGFVPDGSPISVTNNTTGNTIQDSDFEIGGGNTLQVVSGSNIDIPEDTLITLTVSGTLADGVQSGEEINSPAEIAWTSIDGDATDLSAHTTTGDTERTGVDGEGAGLNNYADSDDAPATVTGDISIEKTITDTSEPDADTLGNNVAIGEVVTYQIAVTIPEGSTEGIVVTDDLPPGLQLTGTPTIITNDLNGTVTPLTTTGGTNSGDPITFNIDTATAAGDNDPGNNTFIIEYQAVVLDTVDGDGTPGDNVDGTTLTGDAQLVHNDADGNPIATPIEAPTEPTVTVVEPVLEIVQTLELNGETATNADATVPSGDAGDTVTITLDVTNSGTGGAFEVEIQDLLDPAKFDLSTIDFVTTPDGMGNVNGDGISYTGVDVAVGETETFVFTVKLADGVNPGETLNNVATIVEGDTIDEAPDAGVERDITNPDDIDSNPEALVINGPTLETRLVETAIDNGNGNGNTEAAIGELATYELTLTIPEGTTPDAVLSDALDSGLTFVEFTSITFDGVDAANVTDEATLAANTTVAPNGTGFDINLGDLVSNNVDGNPETITIQYTAAVSNDAANQGETPSALNNDPSFTWNGGANSIDDPVAPSEEISVVEPQLEVIKDVEVNGSGDQGDAGDPIVYTITIQHTGDSTSDAFDVNLNDVLPDGFVPDADAISVINNTTGNTIQDSDFEVGTGNTLQTTGDIDIPEDTLITLTVSGTLADGVQSGETVNSPAEITWTSVDGDASDISDHTTTGDTERTGADGEGAGLNNYADSDDAPATVTGDISIEKTITDTSEPDADTSGNNVAIGEVVTYQIAVTIPEGSTEGIVVTDDLPPGLQLTGTPTIIDTGLNGTVTPLTTTGGTNSGDPITFNIDTATATGDNDPGNNTFIIEYQAVVLDEAGNVDTTTLTGDAQLVHDDAEGNPITTPIEAPTEPTVTVVEPVLEIVQTLELNGETATNADTTVPSGDAGDTVTITLDVTNSGTGGAFEVEIQDLLDPAKFDLSTIDFVTTPDGMGNVNGDGISYTGVDVAVGETQQFVFTVELADGVSPGETLNNVATIVEGDTIDEAPDAGVERDIADPDIDSNPEALIINGPQLETRLVQTAIDNPNNGNTEAAVGELATYELTLTIPEGTTAQAVLNDALDAGLAFVEFTSINLNGITSTTVNDLTDLNGSTTVGTDGTGFNIDLGNLVNAGDQDGDQSITIQYTAVVLNEAVNQGETPSALNNDPSFSWNNGADTIDDPLAASEEISVVEPQLTIQTEVLEDPSTPQENVRRNIGDTVRVRLTLSSDDADAFGADAYDVALSNALPAGVTFAGNLAYVSGVAPNAGTLTEAGGTVNATFDQFPDGSESVIEFDVTLDGTVAAGDITDTAAITYSSVPGDPGTISTHNAASTERTGDGGLNDYRDDDPASITVNQPPETDDAEEFVAPEETINVLNMGGNDTDGGTVDEFRIDTLPDPADGILYLGDPATGGTPINVNQIIPADQIGNLYFTATPGFVDGGEFTYSAIDNEGGIDQTPNTVTLTPNIRPETVDAIDRVPPEGTINVEGLDGSDPDGTVVEYEITSLPGDGTLFSGDPATGGTPVNVGDRIPFDQIDNLFFTAPPDFTGTTFEYFSVDNEGATDLTPAVVTIDSNPRPETNEVINNVPLSSNVPLTGLVGPLGGSDPNGTVDEFRIVSVPDPADGVLFLGDPANGGTVLSANDTVTAGQINNLFFQSTGNFDGATFEYAAIDDEGAEDLTPATVTLNAPPETIDSSGTVPPNGTIPIENLGGSDPDTMVQFYTIDSLPPAADGILYLGSATPGNEVQVGDNLTPMELDQLFFTASPTFTGDTTFT